MLSVVVSTASVVVSTASVVVSVLSVVVSAASVVVSVLSVVGSVSPSFVNVIVNVNCELATAFPKFIKITG